jgi:hypothetical protein
MKGRLDGCLLGTCIAVIAGRRGGRANGAERRMVSTIGSRFLHRPGLP